MILVEVVLSGAGVGGCSTTIVVPGWAAVGAVIAAAAPRAVRRVLKKK